MYKNSGAKCMPATSLLKANKCTSDEKKLFNDMLQYSYQSRPAVSDVVTQLKDMEERRQEEQRREEQRQQEEQRKQEKRRQEEQWNWWKCNVM